ncbi:unnamed protein product [Haemonchus placei]|uniref:Transposase n=1 Tax=Haemonchus placei TaxID=6290 RepID=A0A0N4WQ33_HAEPC|nr:unnamed protein product [Haemonchus placei]
MSKTMRVETRQVGDRDGTELGGPDLARCRKGNAHVTFSAAWTLAKGGASRVDKKCGELPTTDVAQTRV